MINLLAMDYNNTAVKNCLSIITGHNIFLDANTGITYDPRLQHYILNPEGVLSNNRHFIAATRMEYQPNGDGTTEGQALQVLGHCYTYLATKDPKHLERAIWNFDAYVTYYYGGDPIPETAERWIANWIVNAKEPALSNWPVNAASPTHSGFKSVPMDFTDGICKIPHGAPYWGEYLDVAFQAFDGFLSWDAVNATVQGILPDGTVDWSKPGKDYPVDWIIDWEGKKVDSNGDIVSEGHAESEKGTCKLKDTTVSGSHKFNFANRQPMDKGGVTIGRNECQHNRPLHVPLLGGRNQRGNASDAEQWFMDAAYLLWKITGEDRYKKAMDASEFTIMEYTNIDGTDKFFRQSVEANTPFTDGISYDFTYPSGIAVNFSRDSVGYIIAETHEKLTLSMEQQAVWFRVSQASSIRTTYGGKGVSDSPLNMSMRVVMSSQKVEGSGLAYIAPLPPSTSEEIQVIDVPINQLVQSAKVDGSEYILADLRAISSADAIITKLVYVNDIIDGRSANVVESFFPDDDAWYEIGNWLQPDDVAPLTSITYKADADFNLRLTDDNNWRWWWMLSNTNGQWVTKVINKSDGTLSGYQPDRDDRPDPEFPVYNEIKAFSILFDESSTVNATFSYYCLNEIPPRYYDDDGYTMNYRVNVACDDEGFRFVMGDCEVIDYRIDSLKYVPGVIPFSNIYEDGTEQIGAWHGMPYPGYQYPFVYCLRPDFYRTQLLNMVDFLYDSQIAYDANIGVMGPVAAAYIWNRWDNFKYGPPDTFTMYHWGDGTAWSGYQPRAFQGAARAWQELKYNGDTIPPKLIIYTERWITFLATFLRANEGRTPTDFPATSPPTAEKDDYTGHMCGLFLAGAVMAKMGGSTHPDLDYVIETCFNEISDNYVNTGIPNQIMNGSWSPALRLSTGNGIESNGMFFGFWSGETLRALGLYLCYKTSDLNKNLY